jgi:hypothetical protein
MSVQTPGFYLTSVPGVGVSLAGHVVAELGDPRRWPSIDQTASYAGVVCRQTQTGGMDNPPFKSGLPSDCNRVLRDYLLQLAYHAGTTPMRLLKELPVDDEHTLHKHHLRLQNADACSRLGTAKKFLKIAKCLAKQERVYLPAEWLDFDNGDAIPRDAWFRFFEGQLETLKFKWKKYDLSGIDPDKNRLTREERVIDDLRRRHFES